jgi:hypothetical protein
VRAVVAMLLLVVGLTGCWGSDPSLKSLPPTSAGTLEIKPDGRQTDDLYFALVKLGQSYGLVSHGSGTDGRAWQVQWYCKKNGTAIATTNEAGTLVLFQTYVYGFEVESDYKKFNGEMLNLMKQYGKITRYYERKPLSREDLVDRERHMNMDLTSQCRKGA